MIQIFPLIFIIPVLAMMLLYRASDERARRVTVVATAAVLLISGYLFFTSYNLSETIGISYLPSLGINIAIATNPISDILLFLASIVIFMAAIAGTKDSQNQKLSNALLLLFEISAIGVFTSANLFIFFMFWEAGVVALFFMISSLGSVNRKVAAFKFLMYEVFAAAMLLIGILLIFESPAHTLNMATLATTASLIPVPYQLLIVITLGIAFAINMPLFPFHLWLPDAHTEAPTEGSMVLSGVLTKFGAYGLILLFRLMPIASQYAIYVAALAIISSIYSSFVMMKQTDLKRIIAYTTIIEMGIITLGIASLTSIGTTGALVGMMAHGITIALMFLVVGSIYNIFGERDIRVLKGIASSAKAEVYAFIYGTLATTGVPTTATFVAEILIFIGAYQAFGAYALLGLVPIAITGAYLYFVIQKLVTSSSESKPVDYVGFWQRFGYGFMIAAIAAFGIFPFLLLKVLGVG
jgi:proton-translocating NADH-quinone oxidoreductase chain M